MNDASCFGIDLGTTNCAIAVARGVGSGTPPEIETFGVEQLTDAGILAERPTLPSAAYLPFSGEFSAEQLNYQSGPIVGIFAREHGALSPERLVTSAKSWLCQSVVERTDAILPWGASTAVEKLSPVDAASLYLRHLVSSTCNKLGVDFSSWLEEFAGRRAGRLAITVPASFDEVARALTTRAAAQVGIHDPVLLEEPLAAFYAWLARHPRHWPSMLTPGEIVLVCDLGGGTADFTLIQVLEKNGELALERLFVGEHILLGGDNMDLALAETLRGQLSDQEVELDQWQFLSLVHQSRSAKEVLLADSSRDSVTVGIASRSSNLFRSAISVVINRQLVEQLIVQGFFPRVEFGADPTTRRSALREVGLDYAADPAITKHLAAFLRRSRNLRPTAVLFNGGVFKSSLLRRAIIEQLSYWNDGTEPRELGPAQHASDYYNTNEYDSACAQGAAYYLHLLNSGASLRVRAGLPRAYFLGIESSGLAVPGARPRLRALCVAPQGAEEGSENILENQNFVLTTGDKVSFRLFGSTSTAEVKFGEWKDNPEAQLSEYGVAEVVFQSDTENARREQVPVQLISRITPLGTLELWMHERGGARQWQVAFETRADEVGA